MNKYIVFVVGLLWCQIVPAQKYITPMFPCTETLEGSYGVCAHITRPQADFTVMKADAEAMKSAGITWVRSDFDYSTIKKKDGAYQSVVLDSVVSYMSSQNTSFLPIFDRKFNGYAWDDTISYKEYVQHCVLRYSDKLKYWEFMNEVDLIGVEAVQEKYLMSLKQVHSIFKKSNSDAKLLMGSLSGLRNNWLQFIGENQVYRYFDILNLHLYSIPEFLPLYFQQVRDNMIKYNWKSPVWITEFGLHTAFGDEYESSFYGKTLPLAFKRLNINTSKCKCCVIRDNEIGYSSVSDDEESHYINDMFSRVEVLDFNNFSASDVDEHSVLIASSDEAFPIKYLDVVIQWLKKGGTVIFPWGLPLYYDLVVEGTGVGQRKCISDSQLRRLHMSTKVWWTDSGKRKGVPQNINTIISIDSTIVKEGSFAARFVDGDNLMPGDVFEELVYGMSDGYKGGVSGVYKLRSDLKGNIIVNARTDEERYVNREKEQARRLARYFILSYAYGIDKVFTYNLRALENDLNYSEDNYGLLHKDFSHKPGYIAYKTLVEMLPNGSTRPRLVVNGDMYVASWHRPDNTPVSAVWTSGLARSVNIRSVNNEIFDYTGHKLLFDQEEVDSYLISDEILYFVGGEFFFK